tara:strand:- start:476 stop:727 length:252 start_codon:yes stop_codon:yes gene_type:complete
MEQKTISIVVSLQRGVNSTKIPVENNIKYRLEELENTTSVTYKVNEVDVSIPFNVKYGDEIFISINKIDEQKESNVILNGLLL